VQKDLLASKLETGPDSDRPGATRPDLPLCEVAKCQLCEVAKAVPDFTTQLCDTARPGLDFTVAGSRPALALVAGFKSFDSEAGHLLELVRLQVVTRGEAKKAAREEHPFAEKPAHGLIDLILKHQGTDPLCCRLKKELSQKLGSGQEGSSQRDTGYEGTGRQGYTLDQRGLLCYKGRAVVPIQKSLIQELLYLYHDDQLAGH
jgi:hypothetical protein